MCYNNYILSTAMPRFITSPGQNTEVIDKRTVRFTCEGNGKPAVTYTWFYANSSGMLHILDVPT